MHTRFVQKVPGMSTWNATGLMFVDMCGMTGSCVYNLHISVCYRQLR
jgi:hypothetical protein